MEAIILGAGQATRMGSFANGCPKPLLEVAGRPLIAYQITRLADAGVSRVIVTCAAGKRQLFERRLAALGPEIVISEEPERYGRGGGFKHAAGLRREEGEVLGMNGDELVDVDFARLVSHHRASGAVATITTARPRSPFGVVEFRKNSDVVRRFVEAGYLSQWVSCGVYVFSPEALERFPDRGDHETTTFPELVAEGSLRAFRHLGLWLTVNTPKDLVVASEHIRARPEWLACGDKVSLRPD